MRQDLQSQDHYYNSALESHFWIRSRLAQFLAQLSRNSISITGKQGLEVGCGNGVLCAQLENFLGCRMDGTDIRDVEDRAQILGTFFTYDIRERKESLAAKYDFIVIFDVLEHIDEPISFLNDLAFHLKPGGYVFINVPAIEFFRSRYDTIAGHRRRYSIRLLKREFAASGRLKILDAVYWGLFFVPLVLARKVALFVASRTNDQKAYDIGFRPPFPLANKLLSVIGKMESTIFGHAYLARLSFLGTSVLATAQKD